jgi:four helix bundle protein
MRDHRDMAVWKLANEVRQRVMELTDRSIFRDHLWLRTQMRKAANSACANTGEGFSRYYPKDHGRFVVIAKSSLTELIEHFDDVRQLGLASQDETTQIVVLARRARGAATGLIRYLKQAEPPV